jgi:hypothetical protein
LPRFARTFEDATVPETWQMPHTAMVPAAPVPPAPPAWSQTEDKLRAGLIANELPAQAETGINDPVRGRSANVAADYIPFANLDSGSRLTSDCVDPERWPTEEQLGAGILDTCREVQAAIGHWQSTDGTVNSVDPGHGSLGIDEDPVLPVPTGEYDVVEPDGAGNVTGVHDVTHQPEQADSRSAGRYVPKPKYRQVFSTLRRRLGRSLNRKA